MLCTFLHTSFLFATNIKRLCRTRNSLYPKIHYFKISLPQEFNHSSSISQCIPSSGGVADRSGWFFVIVFFSEGVPQSDTLTRNQTPQLSSPPFIYFNQFPYISHQFFPLQDDCTQQHTHIVAQYWLCFG